MLVGCAGGVDSKPEVDTVDTACVPAVDVCNDRDDDSDEEVDKDAVDAGTRYLDADGFGVTELEAYPAPVSSVTAGGDEDH